MRCAAEELFCIFDFDLVFPCFHLRCCVIVGGGGNTETKKHIPLWTCTDMEDIAFHNLTFGESNIRKFS